MRCSRLLPFSFVCLLAILVSELMLAQSDPATTVNQPNGIAPSVSPLPRLPFGQGGTTGFKATARRSGTPQQSGLDFANAVTYNSGGYYAISVAVADVNGDGKPDIVVTNEFACISGCNNPSVAVLLGNGDGTFQTAVAYDSGGNNAYSVAVADVNRDGKPDILVTNCVYSGNNCEGYVSVLLGNGDGTFQPAVSYRSEGYDPQSVAVADVNGDGKPDLVVANPCQSWGNCSSGPVSVLLGSGDGTFQNAVTYSSGSWDATSVAVADLNGDGKPDIVVTNCSYSGDTCSGVGVLLGNGDGTFQPAVNYNPGTDWSGSVAVADVNGDGKPDIVVAGDQVGVLLGNGDGTFQTAVTYGGQFGAGSAAVADVNGDGKLDIVVASGGNGGHVVGVLLGNGDGTFQTAVTYDSGGVNSWAVAVADVNGDGKPDLLVANPCASVNPNGNCVGDGVVGVLINTSTTATTTALASSLNPSSFGQAVTFTATVTAQQGFYKGTPTGTVSFSDGTTNLGNPSLNGSGVGSLTTSTLAVGTHSITATYNGDANFAPSASPVLNQIVLAVPIVSLSTTSLNFGNQAVHKISEPQYVTLSNTGAAPLTINSISSTSSEYSQTSSCPISPNTLPVDSSCLITVRFTPSAVGTRTGSIIINDNAAGSPQTVGLTGNGVVGHVTLSTTDVVFGVQLLGTTSKSMTVKLTNTGTAALNISGIAVSGDFALVSIANQCPGSGSVPPKSSCNLAVKFSPTSVGTRYGTITITDSDPASPNVVGLSGTGTAVKLSPTKLSFGSVAVGKSSKVKTVTMSNAGSSPLGITGITVGGTNPGDFTQANTCGSSLAAGAKCFINVTFMPTAKGARSAIISVADSDPTSPQTITLTGTGT